MTETLLRTYCPQCGCVPCICAEYYGTPDAPLSGEGVPSDHMLAWRRLGAP
jgi:hypothetical protein